ncbi:permease [Ancylobacter mangrovi]|uniref:permease n=1 Tax=Ancylobacter mangrovi TaxID=2972472 RepID=UPI0021618256|nr:permease [Ancylobacter mangrovi]MCS0503721.1 permease [Ancylobacter mangrovi]
MLSRTSLMFVGFAVVAAFANWWKGGMPLALQSAGFAAEEALQVAPELVFGLLIAAFSSILVSRERVARWLGAEAGLRGLVIATLVGALMPGGPFASFPLVFALYQAGADVGALTAFLVAWAAIGVNRLLVWEIPFMGVEFGLLRLVSSLPLPILAGLGAQFLASRLEFFRMRREEEAE